jgi:hypothetical protein
MIMSSPAIEILYRVFKPYGLKPIVGCPCCTTTQDSDHFQGRSLHHLSPSELERLAFKAMTTMGDVDDFRHFLPRLFEILWNDGAVGGTDAEVLVSKLKVGKWLEWPAGQIDAVRAFLHTWWGHVCQEYPGTISASNAICAIARAEQYLAPYLTQWQQVAEEGGHPLRHLADLVLEELSFKDSGGIKLRNAFWAEHRAEMDQVILWLRHDDLVRAMEAGSFRASPEDAKRVSTAAQCLSGLTTR